MVTRPAVARPPRIDCFSIISVLAPYIHINISISNPKVTLNNVPVIIKGVYPHIFQIED